MTSTTWHFLEQDEKATTTARRSAAGRQLGSLLGEKPLPSTTAEAMDVAADITKQILLARKPLMWSKQNVHMEISPPKRNTDAPEVLDNAHQNYWVISKAQATPRPTVTKKLLEDIYQTLLGSVTDVSLFISHEAANLPAIYSPTLSGHVLPEIEALLESPLGLPPGLVYRLKELNSYAWDDEEQSSMQVMSLLSLKNFLDEYKPASTPKTTITLNGNIIAEWRQSKTNLLTLEFLSNGAVKFIFFHRLGQAEQQVNRVSGIATVHNLSSALNWNSVSSLLNE
jgi:hypothetical protein